MAKKACQIFSVMSSNSFSISFFVTVIYLENSYLGLKKYLASQMIQFQQKIQISQVLNLRLQTKFTSFVYCSHPNRLKLIDHVICHQSLLHRNIRTLA